MTTTRIAIFFIIAFVSCTPQGQHGDVATGLRAPVEQKIDSLLSIMTIEEKVGQMVQYSGGFDITGPVGENMKKEEILTGRVGSMLNVIGTKETRAFQEAAVNESRLGIPLLFAYDVIHGYKTMFPIPLAEAASWDLQAVKASARTAAREASAAGIHWTFGPMVDIARDARWGRIMEGAGEDPYLGSVVAAARVRGFQGEDLSAPNTIAACAKHYAAYGFAEAGRDYNTVDISENTLHNVALPPFKACVDAGVLTVMNAFNELGGVPITGSAYLQRDILKERWGFNGFVVSDWATIAEMVTHGFAADKREAARKAVVAGCDMDMEARAYSEELVGLVEDGEVDPALIDESVRRILRVKYRLGLFDDPFRYIDPDREATEILSEKNLAIARDVAKRSIVLLKNEGGLLPLEKSASSIAVIGPLADDKDSPLGSWRAQAVTNTAVSVLEGIRASRTSEADITYAKGVSISREPPSFRDEVIVDYATEGIPEAVRTARGAGVVVMVLGEVGFQSGEGRSRADIGLPGVQQQLLEAVYEVNKNIVLVLMNGRPLTITWAAEHIPAIVEAWHLGSESGHAIADVLFGDYNPSGKLPVSFPRTVGQEPLYYNHKNTGRPVNKDDNVFWSHYIDVSNEPLYPFGYGLSYTSFEYSALQLSSGEMRRGETVNVSVTVQNTGDLEGEEVVQLYIRDITASTTRPVKELKGFQKIRLEPGAAKEVQFTLTEEDLQFYTINKKWEAEPGAFNVYVGGNSEDVLETSFTLL